MSDDFNDFLARSLAPEERLPDRAFVRRVELDILMDERLAAARLHLRERVAEQVVALGAVTLAAVIIARSEFMTSVVAGNGSVALISLLALFALVVLAIGRETGEDAQPLVNGS